MRYWLTHPEDQHFDAKVTDICDLYRDAPALSQTGKRVMSTDELTGVQALERQIRDVATGQIVEPYGGTTRTEADFLAQVQGVVASDETAVRWHFVADNLNTHCSESLVRWVAQESGLDLDLGRKGKSGILANRHTRGKFLSDASHRIVFHYTPKHTSWMNQVEIWLSILVRKLLKQGYFPSVNDLQRKALGFIDCYNRTMARPFKWTYQGKVLVAYTMEVFAP